MEIYKIYKGNIFFKVWNKSTSVFKKKSLENSISTFRYYSLIPLSDSLKFLTSIQNRYNAIWKDGFEKFSSVSCISGIGNSFWRTTRIKERDSRIYFSMKCDSHFLNCQELFFKSNLRTLLFLFEQFLQKNKVKEYLHRREHRQLPYLVHGWNFRIS